VLTQDLSEVGDALLEVGGRSAVTEDETVDGVVGEVVLAKTPEGKAVIVACLPHDGCFVDVFGEHEGEVQPGGDAADVGVIDGGVEHVEELVAACAIQGPETSDMAVEVDVCLT
jgi:hypothetical protein